MFGESLVRMSKIATIFLNCISGRRASVSKYRDTRHYFQIQGHLKTLALLNELLRTRNKNMGAFVIIITCVKKNISSIN